MYRETFWDKFDRVLPWIVKGVVVAGIGLVFVYNPALAIIAAVLFAANMGTTFIE